MNWFRRSSLAASSATLFLSLAASAQTATAPARPSTQPTTDPAPAAAPSRAFRFGIANPPAKPANTLRLMSYNIENLFDDHDDPALSGRFDDKDELKPAAHRAAAAEAIRRANPDVIAMQEVESLKALLWFRDEFLSDMGYTHVVSLDSGDDRGIENSVLSRFPLKGEQVWPDLPLGGTHPEKSTYRGEPIAFRRSPLRVTVEVPDATKPDAKPYVLTLFVVHQKSGRDNGYWRTREATKTVELAKELLAIDPNYNIAIVGDMNCRPTEQPFRVYIGAGFVDAFADRPKDDPDWITHESGRAIDHILLSTGAAKELIASNRFILGVPARPEGVDWRTTPPPEGYASDHYPVVVDLSIGDK